MFGSGVTIGRGTVLLPSAYMAPEAQVADGRVVGALATAAHPTRRNRCGEIVVGRNLKHDMFFVSFRFVYPAVSCTVKKKTRRRRDATHGGLVV